MTRPHPLASSLPRQSRQGSPAQVRCSARRAAQTLLTSGKDAAAAPLQTGALTDEEVVARVRAGDTHFFEVLMRRYNQRLYRAVRAILQNDADAEDALQQTYLNAYRHLAQFEGRARFSTWLTRIAVYEALSRRRRARDKPLGSGDDERVEHVVSAAPDPERQTYAGELGTLLESALAAEAFRFGGSRCDTMVASVKSRLSGMNFADAGRVGGDAVGNLS